MLCDTSTLFHRCGSDCAGKSAGGTGQVSLVPKGGVARGEAAKRQEILNQLKKACENGDATVLRSCLRANPGLDIDALEDEVRSIYENSGAWCGMSRMCCAICKHASTSRGFNVSGKNRENVWEKGRPAVSVAERTLACGHVMYCVDKFVWCACSCGRGVCLRVHLCTYTGGDAVSTSEPGSRKRVL